MPLVQLPSLTYMGVQMALNRIVRMVSNAGGILTVTTAQRLVLSATATLGQLVYDTSESRYYGWDGSFWQEA